MGVSVYWQSRRVGTLVVEAKDADTVFSVECGGVDKGLYRVWAQGERELLLGTSEAKGGRLYLKRQYSPVMTKPVGTVFQGRLEQMACPAPPPQWEKLTRPEAYFRTPEIREQLRGVENAWVCRDRGMLRLALPFDTRRPFILSQMFCFARITCLKGGQYAVFLFDAQEFPKMQ